MFRTDSHNNPSAFTVDVAAEAGLHLGVDYTQGDPFTSNGHTYHTARLLGDPIETTIRVINTIGFVTSIGTSRWGYITIPKFLWDAISHDSKRDVIGWQYQREGGETMRHLFPHYGLP